MLRRTVLFAMLSFAAATPPRAEPLQAHYLAYAAGLNVLALDATIDVSSFRYRLDLAYRTTGALSLFVSSAIDTQVEGSFLDGRAQPSRMSSSGTLRGERRLTQIDYQAGQPVIRQLVPTVDAERDKVPPEAQRGTIDTLSAMAQLIHQVNATARCDGQVRTFDGRRLAELRAWTIGTEQLPPTRLSLYAGPALHCGFEGRQLAGFIRGEDPDQLRREQRGSAWFAPLGPGQPMLPVRISFHTRWFGDATMFIATPQ